MRMLKKISTITFLSLGLIFSSMTTYNSMIIHKYNSIYQSNKENKAIWIANISDQDKVTNMYKNYYYSDSDYKKDQAFFNEVFKKDIFVTFNEITLKDARFEDVDKSIISYLTAYNKYNGDVNLVLKQKEINKLYSKGELSYSQYYQQYEENIKNIHPDPHNRLINMLLYVSNFEIGDYKTSNIDNFNHLFEIENLPPFIFSMEKVNENKKRINQIKGNYKLYKSFIEQQNTTFMDFLNKYQTGKLTEKQKYDFFKILHFINTTMNNKYKNQVNIDSDFRLERNIFYKKYRYFIEDQTKIYEQMDNNIAEKYDIYGTSRENLDSFY